MAEGGVDGMANNDADTTADCDRQKSFIMERMNKSLQKGDIWYNHSSYIYIFR